MKDILLITISQSLVFIIENKSNLFHCTNPQLKLKNKNNNMMLKVVMMIKFISVINAIWFLKMGRDLVDI